MQFLAVALLSLALIPSLAASSPHCEKGTIYPETPCLPFNFTFLFSATINLGRPSSPIPISGGVLINELIVSGTVSGPNINAIIQGGFAHPPIYNNGTLQIPIIDLYGVTNDGESFYIHEVGIGSNAAQVTRIEINIGGTKYAPLRDGFILASVNANANRTAVMVQGFLVENTFA